MNVDCDIIVIANKLHIELFSKEGDFKLVMRRTAKFDDSSL